MARTRRWWDGVPPVRAPVDCDGARHHVAWRGGRIVLEDHGNPTDERALVALGARRSACVGVVEAWRGELIHWITTDGEGRISRYAIKDPSFNNWTGLAIAVRGNVVADFPLCNKSFNLSYSGNDL